MLLLSHTHTHTRTRIERVGQSSSITKHRADDVPSLIIDLHLISHCGEDCCAVRDHVRVARLSLWYEQFSLAVKNSWVTTFNSLQIQATNLKKKKKAPNCLELKCARCRCTSVASPQRQRVWLPWVPAVDRPVVRPVLSGARRHGRQLPGAVLHPLHRRGLLGSNQLYLHLRRFQKDDKAGPPQPHKHPVQSQPGHSVRLPLHAWYVCGYVLWLHSHMWSLQF